MNMYLQRITTNLVEDVVLIHKNTSAINTERFVSELTLSNFHISFSNIRFGFIQIFQYMVVWAWSRIRKGSELWCMCVRNMLFNIIL